MSRASPEVRAPAVVDWAADLLVSLGRSAEPTLASRVEATGADPILATRFRVGDAVAAALVAAGVASDDLWRLRGGSPQQLALDVRVAAASLLWFLLLRVPGLDLLRAPPPTVALYRARDRCWLHLHGGFPHLHEGTLALLGCADEARTIARAVAGWDAQDLEDALAAAGLCGARLRSASEWAAHPAAHRGGLHRFYGHEGPWSARPGWEQRRRTGRRPRVPLGHHPPRWS